jgi:hypothetical protein
MSYNFQVAENKGIITSNDYKVLYETAKNIFYPHRTYQRVFNESSLEKNKITELGTFLDKHGIDIKAEDAKKALKYIKGLI